MKMTLTMDLNLHIPEVVEGIYLGIREQQINQAIKRLPEKIGSLS